jgi:hypothetical protein
MADCRLELQLRYPALILSCTKRHIKLFTRRSFYTFRYRRLPAYLIAIGAGLLPGLGVYLLGITITPQQIDSMTLQHWIWIIGILLATVGWVVTARTTHFTSRRQHTISVLSQHRFDDKLENDFNIVRARFPLGTHISEQNAAALDATEGEPCLPQEYPSDVKPSLKEVCCSLVSVLNYYEFLAVGIKHRDLDATVMEDFYKGMFCSFCETAREYIRYEQTSFKDERLYENIVDLYKAWAQFRNFPDSDRMVANVQVTNRVPSQPPGDVVRKRTASTKRSVRTKKKPRRKR